MSWATAVVLIVLISALFTQVQKNTTKKWV